MSLIADIAENIKLIGGCISGVAAVGGSYIYFDGPTPAKYVDSRLEKRIGPLIVAQLENKASLDFLLLRDERQALKDAKEDLARNPSSTTIPTVIERLERSIEIRQRRLQAQDPQAPTSGGH